MSKHAPQPQLCPDCEIEAQSFAEAGPAEDVVFQRCPHNWVIALASKNGARIVTWMIQGPIDPDNFDAFAIATVAQMLGRGMKIHEITRQ